MSHLSEIYLEVKDTAKELLQANSTWFGRYTTWVRDVGQNPAKDPNIQTEHTNILTHYEKYKAANGQIKQAAQLDLDTIGSFQELRKIVAALENFLGETTTHFDELKKCEQKLSGFGVTKDPSRNDNVGRQRKTLQDKIDRIKTPTLRWLEVEPKELNLSLGEPTVLKVIGYNTDGTETGDLYQKVDYSIPSNKFVHVSQGLLTPIAEGETEFTASYEEIKGNPIKSAPIKVTITRPAAPEPVDAGDLSLKKITIFSSAVSLAVGKPQKFTALGTFGNGVSEAHFDITAMVQWNSTNLKTLHVEHFDPDKDKNGLATARNVGTAQVFASYQGINSEGISVDVKYPAIESIVIEPATPTFEVGKQNQFRAFGKARGAVSHEIDITEAVEWEVEEKSLLRLGNGGALHKGQATPLDAGSCTVRATYLGVHKEEKKFFLSDPGNSSSLLVQQLTRLDPPVASYIIDQTQSLLDSGELKFKEGLSPDAQVRALLVAWGRAIELYTKNIPASQGIPNPGYITGQLAIHFDLKKLYARLDKRLTRLPAAEATYPY